MAVVVKGSRVGQNSGGNSSYESVGVGRPLRAQVVKFPLEDSLAARFEEQMEISSDSLRSFRARDPFPL